MSVQAGIWNFDGKPVDGKLLADISESLTQRGPDGESTFVDGSIALLYRPFHTTAESRRENQPYVSHRGFILTWDGRLDNRDELILELRSELETEPTDVAIIAAAFDRWGTDCFRRIIGDWAVSIWKYDEHELLFAADYMAIRHIFYYLKNNQVRWATDLSPLVLLSGDKFHIDEEYIAGYFAHYPDAHLTPYHEIREVPPGRFVRIRKGSVSIERFWSFSSKLRIRYKTDTEYEEHFLHLFRQSVGRRLRSDSPILAELSGGLDSSSIVCMADYILTEEGVSASGLGTLSYYDKTEPQGDDWTYFEEIEKKRGKVGVHIDASKLASDSASLDYTEFNSLPGYLPIMRILETERASMVMQGRYRAVLSGIGGDEFLGGIPNPTALLADLIVRFKPIDLIQQLAAWSHAKRIPWIQLLREAIIAASPASVGYRFASEPEAEPWIEEDFAKRTQLTRRLFGDNESQGFSLPTRRAFMDGFLLMANKLAKWNSPILAHEECRYPYLDRDFIEFVFSIPASQLLRPNDRRSLMKRALTGIVPARVLSRTTKQYGSRMPVVLLEKSRNQLEGLLHSSICATLGFVTKAGLLEMLNGAKNGNNVPSVRIFRAIALELWLRHLSSRNILSTQRLPLSDLAAMSAVA
jgi:asparagine synthase (glutamine-hydrolysing)